MSAVCSVTQWHFFSPTPSPSVCINKHMHCLHACPVSQSLLLHLSLVTTTTEIWVAVGACSQSLHYSAFSSSSACPSLGVSTACLNYSHQGHYWEHSSLLSFTIYLPLIHENSSRWNRWSVRMRMKWGHISWIFISVEWVVPEFLQRITPSNIFLGELLKASLMGLSVPLICAVSCFHAEVQMTKSQQSWI